MENPVLARIKQPLWRRGFVGRTIGNTEGVSTLQGLRYGSRPWVIVGRRLVLGLLLAAVVCAALGLLGVHRRTVSATADGITLTVTYPGVARPGLDVPLRVMVVSDHGFGDDITLAVNRDYLGILESQGIFPDVNDATALGDDRVMLTFSAPPSGNVFVVDFDTYIQPGSQIGAAATISVMDGTTAAVTVAFSTFLFP